MAFSCSPISFELFLLYWWFTLCFILFECVITSLCLCVSGCNCHGHSDSCHFDAARFEASLGVSGGVCDNCRHDRTGAQCERCRPFLYQDPQRSRDDPHACIRTLLIFTLIHVDGHTGDRESLVFCSLPTWILLAHHMQTVVMVTVRSFPSASACDCDPAGSQEAGLCDALTGRCICKENVEGQRCDRCKYGFFNLQREDPAGCQGGKSHFYLSWINSKQRPPDDRRACFSVCSCHVTGSIGSCDQQTGRCECDRLAAGPLCDHCLVGSKSGRIQHLINIEY